MQTDTAGTYTALSNSSSKAMDYLVVIAGWPTIYSVVGTGYTLATTTTGGDALGQFTGIQAAAHPPKAAGASFKGKHPEEGGQSIGTLTVDLLDKRLLGKRIASELTSRMAYLFGNASGNTTTLAADLTAAATTVTLTDGTNFPALSVIYIGQEAIKLGDKVGNVYGGGGTPCVRGYRITDATPHLSGVKTYDFMPNLSRRKLLIYKSYQSQTTTAGALRCFSGVVVDDAKKESLVTLTAAANTWEMHADGTKKICNLYDDTQAGAFGAIGEGNNALPMYPGDFTMGVITALSAAQIGDGHTMVQIGNSWLGITSAADAPYFGPQGRALNVVSGLGASPLPDYGGTTGQSVKFGWTNADFTQANPTGDEPVRLLLKFLLSVNGDGANDATYDVFRKGIGLGIPASRVNIASFTAIMANLDYDANQRVFLIFTKPEEALAFIESELCQPFGYSLVCGNDGRINLKQHRSPQHFYISGPNNELNFTPPTGDGTQVKTTLASGVYTPAAMATEIARALNLIVAGFTCTYSTTTNKFTINHASSFIINADAPTDNAWPALGFTTKTTGAGNHVADNATCAATLVAATLSENDIDGLVPAESRDTQIASVSFLTNYDFINDKFARQYRYIDAEAVNLGDELGAREYQIKSKGLIGGAQITALGAGGYDPTATFHAPAAGCTGTRAGTAPASFYDSATSWANIYALSLLHRYKQPPLVLKATLLWKWNLLEQGDVIKLNYSIDGVVTDFERDTTTLASRNFEIASITHNFGPGTVEVVLVGHRWQGF